MEYESQKDLDAKAARLVKIDKELRHIELAWELTGDKSERDIKERRRLLQEQEWYKRGHTFASWPAFLADMEAQDRKAAAEAAARAKTAAEKAAEAARREAEERAKIEAIIAAENDPVTLYRRAHSTRYF